uniref:Uncharacterized protein n=1 Tax=Spongospora subterranea TaxID=70186 RepID=A0A0H5RHY7_9EUKA|eukprot:CRZ08279.1 hypothetical protein [Spongospora subterranea]
MVKRMDWQACDFEEQDFAYSPVNSSEHQLDKDGVPLAISGECSYRFERMSEKANLMQRYSHWQFRCTKSKKLLNPKTNDVAITLQYKVCAGLIRCSNSDWK